MKKPIYIREGISEQIKYSDKTSTNNYIIMGSQMYKMYNILMEKENKQIDPDLADIKVKAILDNAYLYPGWDYIKYPQVDLYNTYSEAFTNEKFEEVGKDIYDDPILIFTGRERDL